MLLFLKDLVRFLRCFADSIPVTYWMVKPYNLKAGSLDWINTNVIIVELFVYPQLPFGETISREIVAKAKPKTPVWILVIEDAFYLLEREPKVARTGTEYSPIEIDTTGKKIEFAAIQDPMAIFNLPSLYVTAGWFECVRIWSVLSCPGVGNIDLATQLQEDLTKAVVYLSEILWIDQLDQCKPSWEHLKEPQGFNDIYFIMQRAFQESLEELNHYEIYGLEWVDIGQTAP